MSHERTHLFDDYYIREATPQEFGPFFKENRPKVFSDTLTIQIDDYLTDAEKEKQNLLSVPMKDIFIYRLFVLKGDEIVGWHMGRQIDQEQFYMGNTGIFKEHQGKGIYTALLPRLIEIYRSKGFQKITSRHIASNSSVLVPKLKAGFVITGFEISEIFGLLVVLTYFTNEKRHTAYKFRTGALRPDEDIKRFL